MSGRRPGAGRLRDKVTLVTGAARGIGADIARIFVEEGAPVMVADIAAMHWPGIGALRSLVVGWQRACRRRLRQVDGGTRRLWSSSRGNDGPRPP